MAKENPELVDATLTIVRATFKAMLDQHGDIELPVSTILECFKEIRKEFKLLK